MCSPCVFTHMIIGSWTSKVVLQSLEDVIISKLYIQRPVFVHQTFHFALLSPQGLRNKVRVHAFHAFTNARAFNLIHFIHYCFHLVPFVA